MVYQQVDRPYKLQAQTASYRPLSARPPPERAPVQDLLSQDTSGHLDLDETIAGEMSTLLGPWRPWRRSPLGHPPRTPPKPKDSGVPVARAVLVHHRGVVP